jgi:predicted RNA-binding Zn ribbon-like protein
MGSFEAPRWKFIGGRLCIDFVNSAAGRSDKRVKDSFVFSIREERLKSYKDLVSWAKEAGVLTERDAKRLIIVACQTERKAKLVLERAIALRESLFKILKHIIEGWEPSNVDIETLNRECVIARNRQSLVYSSHRFAWNLQAEHDSLDRMLWPIALSGAELLSSEDLSRIRQCPGSDCGWLFLDTSKNRSRHWCDMKDCGNLAKVRRYRERQA